MFFDCSFSERCSNSIAWNKVDWVPVIEWLSGWSPQLRMPQLWPVHWFWKSLISKEYQVITTELKKVKKFEIMKLGLQKIILLVHSLQKEFEWLFGVYGIRTIFLVRSNHDKCCVMREEQGRRHCEHQIFKLKCFTGGSQPNIVCWVYV